MIDPVAKSRELLNANLTPEQRREFAVKDCFTVEVKDETYELRPDITERLSDHAKFCAVIPGLPVYDQMLARKLYLERDPEAFFKAANLFQFDGRRRFSGYRIDVGLAEQLFKIALMRRFSERGMDARLVEIRMEQCLNILAYEITVIYAGKWAISHSFDREHFYVDNLASILEAEAGYFADKTWQTSERDIRLQAERRG